MHDSDTEMECMEANSHHLQDFNNSLGDTSHSNGFSNGFSKDIDIQDENEEAMGK